MAGLNKLLVAIGMFCLMGPGQSQAQGVPTLNMYGVTGLIDMPSAESQPDAELGFGVSWFGPTVKATITFQISPRLSGSFRYAQINDFDVGGTQPRYDRSFDLRFRLLDETERRPAVAIGLQDFIGTGIYSGEYVVATKHLGPAFKVTGGIGWGRLATQGGFTNPLSIFGSSFNTRPPGGGVGGSPSFGQWFRGPAALFGGVEWQTPIRNLSFKAEYSSDAYIPETVTRSLFVRRSPFNFGLDYRLGPTTQISAYYLYGSQFGIGFTTSLNPTRAQPPRTSEPAPIPIVARQMMQAGGFPDRWITEPGMRERLLGYLQMLLADDGLAAIALDLSSTSATLHLRNNRYDAAAQAIGRAARAMAKILPPSVETFTIVPMEGGLPVVSVTLQRSDLERFENDPDGAEKIASAAIIADAASPVASASRPFGSYPKTYWSLAPYRTLSLFNPTAPVVGEVGLRLSGRFEISPGLSLTGSITKRLVGNIHTNTQVSNSVMRHVRSDIGLYLQQGDPSIERLTADYTFRLGDATYGRLSVGYFERMYGGVSAEVLWKPVSSRFGLGAEINYVRQRAFNQLFGFQSYGVTTGHVSAYWQGEKGYSAQVDVGRYLAGDLGATVSVDRVFANGWRVGAFFTLTDVPFSTFGEGGFDKGLHVTIPLSWTKGKPYKDVQDISFRPLTRDGGGRVDIKNRLYPILRSYHKENLIPAWGRFWK